MKSATDFKFQGVILFNFIKLDPLPLRLKVSVN